MLPRIENSVTVPVPMEVAFQAFQDLERLRYRGTYDEVAWVEGAPWEVGSRLRYDLLYPVRTTISSVVASINPPRAIAMINHALGVTAGQNIFFAPDLSGGTLVRITMNLVGESWELSESALQSKVTYVIKDVLDSMAVLCRWSASPASGTALP